MTASKVSEEKDLQQIHLHLSLTAGVNPLELQAESELITLDISKAFDKA